MRILANIKGSTFLYILDMLCMVMALSLLFFILYVFPYVILGYENYDVPTFIMSMRVWIETRPGSHLGGILAFFLPLVFAAVAFMLISRLITYYLETHEHEPGMPHIEQSELNLHRNPKTSHPVLTSSTFLIVGLMVGVLALVALAEYFVIFSIFG